MSGASGITAASSPQAIKRRKHSGYRKAERFVPWGMSACHDWFWAGREASICCSIRHNRVRRLPERVEARRLPGRSRSPREKLEEQNAMYAMAQGEKQFRSKVAAKPN